MEKYEDAYYQTMKYQREKGMKEGVALGEKRGMEIGLAEGTEHGKKMMIISLIKDGLLSKEEGAKRLSISIIELDEYITREQ